MIIGVDGNEANVEQKVGVHQYAYEIMTGLFKYTNSRRIGKDKLSFKIYLKKQPRDDLPPENPNWRYKLLPSGKFWILTRLMPWILFRDKLDVLFTPNHYIPPLSGCPTVCTIHDLGYLEFSEQFKKYDFWQLKYWTAISIFRSKSIIAISNSTKDDIVRHYPSASKKTHTVPHGYDKRKFNTNIDLSNVRRVKDKYSIKGQYILFLSTLKPSKNIDGLLEAFKILTEEHKSTVRLVIGGKKGWMFDSIFLKVKELGLEEKVIFTDYVSEVDKPSLIYGSKMLVLVPHWEGFGMVALEAMACGTPVVVSKVGGLPGVVETAGIYVDHNNPANIASGMKKVLTASEKEYDRLVNNSLEQAKKFSWENTTRKTLKIIKETVI